MGDADKPSGMLQSHKSPLKSMQTYSSGMFGACDLTAMGSSLRVEVEGGSWLKSHVGPPQLNSQPFIPVAGFWAPPLFATLREKASRPRLNFLKMYQ